MSRRYNIMIGIGCMACLYAACLKESRPVRDISRIQLSTDTLYFDTVFTTSGSVTSGFTVINPMNAAIQIDEITLSGGIASPFQINADGVPGPRTGPITIEGKDSIYVFVTVKINAGSDSLPFLVRDSIRIQTDGRVKSVILDAYGQNARFLRNKLINTNTRLNNQLPYVIIGELKIAENTTLTIDKGTRIYLHADAPILVDGTLIVQGDTGQPVIFTGDRLDDGYKNLPGSWPGIYFRPTSTGNQLSHTVIRNGYFGLYAQEPDKQSQYKLNLRQCIIENAYESGIMGIGSSIRAENCLIANCGNNIALLKGGEYHFNHCTVSSFTNRFLERKKPVLLAANWDSTRTGTTYHALAADFVNCIFWGNEGTVDHEAVVSRKGNAAFRVNFSNCLYRGADPVATSLLNNIRNQDPLFDSIDVSKRYFDFRLQRKLSPAINKGRETNVKTDLLGLHRDPMPDIGCYEKK